MIHTRSPARHRHAFLLADDGIVGITLRQRRADEASTSRPSP
jgi:hypothetical protein